MLHSQTKSNQQNINLAINQNEGIWREMVWQAQHFTRRVAAGNLLKVLNENGVTCTPDGIRYTKTNLQCAMRGW